MMLVRHIQTSAEEQAKAASKEQLEVLDKEVVMLRSWGERRMSDVKVPSYEMQTVRIVYEVDGEPYEVMEERLRWDLERANPDMCTQLDRRIVQAYRTVKAAGFKRPSTILHWRMFMWIHSPELDEHYNGKLALFAAARLVVRRLGTTVRTALRYGHPGKFGPKIDRAEDGRIISFEYDGKSWERELVRRGILGSGSHTDRGQ